MRFGRVVASLSMDAQRGGRWRRIVAVALAVFAASGPAAAVPLVLPMDQAFVPIAVAAAFILPALIALMFAGLTGAIRRLGPAVGVGVLLVAALPLVGYLNPGLLTALRT